MTSWNRGAPGIERALPVHERSPARNGNRVGEGASELMNDEGQEGVSEIEERRFEPIQGYSLADDLVDHMFQPESVAALHRAGVVADMLPERDELREPLEAVLDFVDDYGEPPPAGVVAELTGFSERRPPLAPVDYLIDRLFDLHSRRLFKQVIMQAARASSSPDRFETLSSLIGEVQTEVGNRADGVRVTPMTEIEFEPVQWLWEGYLAKRSVTILSGEPGQGKSTMSCGIAAGMTSGKSGEPGNVLFLTTEDSFGMTIKPRLMAAGADLSRVFAVEKQSRGITSHLIIPQDLPLLASSIKNHNAKLVIIDPLMGHLSGRVDSWKEQSIREVMSALYHIADSLDCAILSINHLNKASQQNALNRVGGSMGIVAASRSVLLMARHPEDPDLRVLTSTKLNIGKEPKGLVYQLATVTVSDPRYGEIETSKLVRIGTTELTSDEVLKAGRPSKQEKAEEILLELLADSATGMPVSALREAFDEKGISWATVEKAKRALGETISTERREGHGNAYFWALNS